MCLVFSDFSEVVRTLMIFGVSDMAISAVLSPEQLYCPLSHVDTAKLSKLNECQLL